MGQGENGNPSLGFAQAAAVTQGSDWIEEAYPVVYGRTTIAPLDAYTTQFVVVKLSARCLIVKNVQL